MTLRRVAPPPSDEQLASAEQTDTVRRRDRLKQVEDEQEEERLARAGDPEALEKVNTRAAIRASASVLDSRPVGGDDGDGSGVEVDRGAAASTTTKGRAPSKTVRRQGVRVVEHAASPKTPPPPQQEEESDEDQRAKDEKLAYKLMDLAYKKWAKGAEKDLSKANRALAIDLGKDAMLYLRSGIIRMNDLHATIEKLTASAKAGKNDEGDGEENLDDQLEDLRKAMRGE